MVKTGFMLSVGVVVAGCVPAASLYSRPPVLPPSTPYEVGSADGCRSGASIAGSAFIPFTKDPERYLSDPLYKQGWDDGVLRCRSAWSR